MTSATFSFLGQHPAPAATVLYLHLDGDPQGAANYLRAMLGTGTGYGAADFLRANAEAQLVCGHDVWPNTAFRYTVSGPELLVEQRVAQFEEGWTTVFAGLLVAFLNAQPGRRLFSIALHAGDPIGHYTACQLDSFVRLAQAEVLRCDQEGNGEGLVRARARVERLKAVQRAAHRVEQGEPVVGA